MLRVPRVLLIGLGCVGFLGGLLVAHLGWFVVGWVWWVAAAGLFACCASRRAWIAVPAVIVAGCVCGLLRGSDVVHDIARYGDYVGQKVSVTGVVSDDATYNDKRMIDVYITDVYIGEQSMPGRVRLTTFAPIEPKRGDRLQASGKLYGGFGSYQAAIYYADAQVTGMSSDPVNWVRRQFAASVLSVVPEPQASLGLGFLLGIKSQLPSGLGDQLQALSLTHIVVASGYNLTILVRLARRFFEKYSKFQTVAAGALLMMGFVAVTGFSSSMSRAALVTTLALAAWYYGRRVHPALLIVMAAAITAGVNPLFLWSDIGWWLSFAAFAGVLLLAPLLQRRFFGKRQPKLIGQVVVETLSAQLLTAPIILFIFGQFSLLALPANVLIVPLIPLAMLLTFAAGAIGIVAPALGGLVAWPATVLLGYMTELIGFMARVPWASVPVTISVIGMVAVYVGLFLLSVLLWRKTKLRYLEQSVVE